ncbi:radial spoke head protein 9 homolog [Limulus polyphemus]|uniref:Radial spoke head protein 9 homolog n=1 Tax=Limulus polyphemus TaxID=6850 RepID=A0ABM1BW57_LIMPO|nr:radial spoke head protein 9 homolog [Limulus polyphemus]
MNFVSTCGHILSVEERIILKNSCIILRDENRLEKVQLWGKILGLTSNYFIVQGKGKDLLKDNKIFYSLNGIDWQLLLPTSSEILEKVPYIRGRFTGDPSYHQNVIIVDWEDEGEDKQEQVKEEDRLSAIVTLIDRDTAAVPRGAVLLTPQGEVIRNRSFEGLSFSEATKLHSYLHFRPTSKKSDLKHLRPQADVDVALDFLEPISNDVPQGCWSVQVEEFNTIVLRNWWWPGMTFYHIPATSYYGQLYIGSGEPIMDLPFML